MIIDSAVRYQNLDVWFAWTEHRRKGSSWFHYFVRLVDHTPNIIVYFGYFCCIICRSHNNFNTLISLNTLKKQWSSSKCWKLFNLSKYQIFIIRLLIFGIFTWWYHGFFPNCSKTWRYVIICLKESLLIKATEQNSSN